MVDLTKRVRIMREIPTPMPPVEFRGAATREDMGASFARAFVAGLRQGGDTNPLVAFDF